MDILIKDQLFKIGFKLQTNHLKLVFNYQINYLFRIEH